IMKKIVIIGYMALIMPFSISAHVSSVSEPAHQSFLTSMRHKISNLNARLISGLTTKEDDLDSVKTPIDDDVCMRPIKINGHYYYSKNDTHKHIDLTRALLIMLSPK